MQHEGMVAGLFDLPESKLYLKVPMVSPDANFVNMLRYSMLAVSLLPENSISRKLFFFYFDFFQISFFRYFNYNRWSCGNA